MEAELFQVLAKLRRGLWFALDGKTGVAGKILDEADVQLSEMLSRGYDMCVAPVGAHREPCGVFACSIHEIGEGT